ncbi:hypothetical protein DE146DRAFT_404098 [Phaeosphaeria sp. MPI-PUGE-AT-0046c]|nr:hypothetical protein DE146DRAFT_404098 [Phaeosphaeria sp. MPI-PUGE-AT-0046c]
MLLCPPRAYDVMAGLPPLELRDQVYSYLWDEQAVHRVESQIGDVTNELSELHLSKDWTLQVPHFADANYVDEPFAREAATLFFRVITALEVQYRSVRRFLKMSSFGNMSLCPRDIIRRLVIDVKFAPVGRSYRRIIVLADLRDNLESLLTLPVRDNFEIIIYIDREIQFSRTLFKTLEIMKPIYHALVQKGMKIKVLGFQFFTPAWRNPDDIREEATVGRPCTTAEQLNYYFEMTPMEWLDMKEGELNAIKQPLRRERCMRILDNMREFVGEMESWADDPEMGELLAKLTLKMSAFDTGVQRV